MMLDPKKGEYLRKKKLVSAAAEPLPRTGSTRPPPFAPAEEEAEAVRRVEELQDYRVVLRCQSKPAED